MTVSVIIPTFNRASCICSAIDSVLCQTYKDYEIIIVDDGSTDNTKETIIKRYGNTIRYIYQDNEGVSSARNRGIYNAKGDWIAFLDSDDTWKPDKLDRQIKVLSDTGASICLAGHEDDSGNKFLNFTDSVPVGDYKYIASALGLVFKKNRHPLIQSLIIKKKLIVSLGLFDQTLKVAEDTKLVYRIAFNAGVAYLNDSVFILKRNRLKSGLSDDLNINSALLRYECYNKVQLEAYYSLLPINIELAKIVKANIGYFLSRQAEIYSAMRDYTMARRFAVESLKYASKLHIFIRSFILMLFPYLMQKYFSQKWNYDSKKINF